MRVKLLEGIRMAGPDFNYGPGDEVEVVQVAGDELIARGLAEKVSEPEKPVRAIDAEVATVPEKATATRKPQRKRSRTSKGEA